jgi:transcriptional regulator with XRE-family HTH domain
MISHEDLIKKPEYWFETIQNEIFRQVDAYLKENNMTQTQLAEKLGVTKGYISQIMKGEFNYTLKKLIEISLALGKVPIIEFKSLTEILPDSKSLYPNQKDLSFNKVAEP